MGGVKEQMFREDAQGYSSLDGKVCIECAEDGDLRDLFDEDEEVGHCDFCDKDDVCVTDAAAVQERIMKAFSEEYERADQANLPWDGQEGGYQVETFDASEVVLDQLSGVVSEKFAEEILEAINDPEWCNRDWAILSPYDLFKSGWRSFCQSVMHHHRFTFAFQEEDDPGHPDSTSPGKTVVQIGNIIQDYRLLKLLPAGLDLYRVRADATGKTFSSFDELASPPYNHAAANRMSPAGIPMLYGSPDRATAIAETWDGKSLAAASIAKFVTTKAMWVVDLVDLPPVPGFFSGAERGVTAAIAFLHDLARDASKPIHRDGHEHVEYAPTQVVSEYLMMAHKFVSPADGDPIDVLGIRFGSSRTKQPNLVLNLKHTQHAVGEKAADYLRLVDVGNEVWTPKPSTTGWA